jgi:uncharacterized protein (DUF849 family)
MMDVIINFAPTGMIPTKEMTPHVPITVNEIIEDVHRAYEVGITMVHLHARDEKTGEPTYKAEIYSKIIEGIRKFSKDLIICVSLSGRTFKEFEKRAEPLQIDGSLKPDMGSLTLSSLNFNRVASESTPEMIKALAREMKNKAILPELEAFDLGMINYAKYLLRKNLIGDPCYFNLLFGNIACSQADLLHLGVALRDLPDNSYWCVAGIGDSQLIMNSIAIAFGGGVRVGIEDNIWFDKKRTKHASNLDFIKRIHILAEANERKIMKPEKLRPQLGLSSGGHSFGLQQKS